MINIQPIIKWSGSKRPLAEEIIKYFPNDIETYYEPFIGGGSVFIRILTTNPNIKYFKLSDINQDLINMWISIQNNNQNIVKDYKKHWNIFNSKDISYRKEYFKELKKEFNETKDTSIFFFLNRTSFNGLIRYNSNGFYNSSCHFSRNGIEPNKFEHIFNQWSSMLNNPNIKFECKSYETINNLNNGDLLFCDPPYLNTNGIYNQDCIDFNVFFKWLDNIGGNKYLTFDGKSATQNDGGLLPISYKQHIYLTSKRSSFSNIKNKESYVNESLYIF